VWEVSGSDEFASWYGSLDAKDQSKEETGQTDEEKN
jgi:hypothetical protein